MSELVAGRWRTDTEEVLGVGQFAVVHPAVDVESGRQVAVRLLTRPCSSELLASANERLGRLAALEHPNVVTPLAILEDERVGEVLERVSGAPLTSSDQPLPAASVIALGKQVASALVALHGHGVVHGDVRPERVLLGAHGACLSGCLGLTQLELVRAGATAPEVQRGAAPGVPADLYGLGVVLARAMLGRPPFVGPSDWAVLGAQGQGGHVLQLDGPAGLVGLVKQLLDPSPARRPPDAAAALRVLELLASDPERPRALPRRWLAPVRPGSAWMVVGQDPVTGQRSLVAEGLGRRRAHRLANRLQGEGWEVRPLRAAVGGRQLLMVVGLTIACAVVLPGLGAAVGLLLGWYVASAGSHPELAHALPRARAPIPPRQLPMGTESVFAGGLLLLVASVLLWLWPQAAWVPLVGFFWVLILALRARPRPQPEPAQARLAALLSQARHALEEARAPLDVELALLGEIEELSRLAPTSADPDTVLLLAEDVLERTEELARAGAERSTRRVRALRVPTDEVNRVGS